MALPLQAPTLPLIRLTHTLLYPDPRLIPLPIIRANLWTCRVLESRVGAGAPEESVDVRAGVETETGILTDVAFGGDAAGCVGGGRGRGERVVAGYPFVVGC